MKRSLFILFIALTLALFILGIQTARIIAASQHNKHLANKPFESSPDNARLHFLFLGDSTAVGVGATPETSTAGWLHKDFPDSSIENISQNGLKLEGLWHKLTYLRRARYDAIIVQIGANDIVRMTPFTDVDYQLRALIGTLRQKSDHVIVLHSGDIGTASLFIWPFSWVLSDRSHKVRDIYKKAANDLGFSYVDLIAANTDAPLRKDARKYYAADGFHLSGEGYRVWYEHIRAALLLSTQGAIIRHATEG